MMKLTGTSFVLVLVLALCFGEGLLGRASADSTDEMPIAIEIAVSPQTLVMDADIEWVTVHTDIPLSLVDDSTVALNGISVAWTKADCKGNLVAKFDQEKVKAIAAGVTRLELTLTGLTKTKEAFAGSDTIRVKQ